MKFGHVRAEFKRRGLTIAAVPEGYRVAFRDQPDVNKSFAFIAPELDEAFHRGLALADRKEASDSVLADPLPDPVRNEMHRYQGMASQLGEVPCITKFLLMIRAGNAPPFRRTVLLHVEYS